MDKFIGYSISENIASITLNRSPSNAFSIDFLDEILNALKIASKDNEIRAVIIKSNINNILKIRISEYSNIKSPKSLRKIELFRKKYLIIYFCVNYLKTT